MTRWMDGRIDRWIDGLYTLIIIITVIYCLYVWPAIIYKNLM